MSIIVQCVHCGARLKGKPDDAGKTKACPKCGKPVKVPLRPIAAAEPPRAAQQPPPPHQAARQSPQGDAGLSATLPDVPEEPPHEADSAPPPERFYGGDARQPSVVRWAVALVIFLVGAVACVVILSRKGASKSEESGPMAAVTAETLLANRLLHERAIEASKNNDKEEATKLYKELIAKLEKYPPGYPSGLNQISLELRAIETGRTPGEIWAEEHPEAQQTTPPAVQQPSQDTPAVQPDAQPDQQPDTEPPQAPDAQPAQKPDAKPEQQPDAAAGAPPEDAP